MDIVSRLAGVIGSENVSYCDSELQSYGEIEQLFGKEIRMQ